MMDGACLQWQQTCSTEGNTEGSCWIYNDENLSWRMFGLGLIMKVAAVSLFSLALFFYRPAMDEANEAVAAASGSTIQASPARPSPDLALQQDEVVPLDGIRSYKHGLEHEEDSR